MILNGKFSRTVSAFFARTLGSPARRLIAVIAAVATALAMGGLALALSFNAKAAPSLLWGTLDTLPAHAAAEGHAGVTMGMLEFNWGSFEPSRGTLSSSYLGTMQSELAAYQAGGQRVTLALGLYDPPSWVFNLANSTLRRPERQPRPARPTSCSARPSAPPPRSSCPWSTPHMPMSDFWAIRLTSGGDGEMLYPGGGTYWAFDNAALTGNGLAAGMTRNPDPNWRPGTAGLTQAQINELGNWYVGGLDNVTNWQMQTLSGLGFTGYYETVTPGSGTRPDYLAQTEQHNLPNDGTTGVGAVWDLYYAMLPDKTNVIAYISSVADKSGGNDACQASDTSCP